mmetsp:Transcript_9906/g.22453  ORF Transcript_9906/g.22453 Transcript_9906/m.22453 type:complete len:202 (-) Transcript_9906:112-717(-)
MMSMNRGCLQQQRHCAPKASSLRCARRHPLQAGVVRPFLLQAAVEEVDAALEGKSAGVGKSFSQMEGYMTNMEWAKTQGLNEVGESGQPASYTLKFMWLPNELAVCVDQVLPNERRLPVTEFFYWPRTDAWLELKAQLDGMPWISERDTVIMLNTLTEVINHWTDATSGASETSVEDAREAAATECSKASSKFESCDFIHV